MKRFVVDDFGWGKNVKGLPEFGEIHARRVAGWDYARVRAEANGRFTWTGISSGNSIDWVSWLVIGIVQLLLMGEIGTEAVSAHGV